MEAFLDTNIIIYAYSEDEIEKANIANKIINEYQCFISTQVVNEVSNVFFKKFNLSSQEVLSVVEELERFLTIIQFDIDTIKYAYKIKDKYKFSYFDSLIIATALNHNCQILYTEDMQHNQIIEDKLKIINPFEDIKEREYKK